VALQVIKVSGDRLALRRSIAYFLDNIAQQTERRETINRIGEDLFAIALDQPFRFPATFTFVLRAFSTLEGIGKTLDPGYQFAEVATPYATVSGGSSGSLRRCCTGAPPAPCALPACQRADLHRPPAAGAAGAAGRARRAAAAAAAAAAAGDRGGPGGGRHAAAHRAHQRHPGAAGERRPAAARARAGGGARGAQVGGLPGPAAASLAAARCGVALLERSCSCSPLPRRAPHQLNPAPRCAGRACCRWRP
jgi:hypothetical protein